MGISFSWWPIFGLKIDIKYEETSENMWFSAIVTTSNTWLVQSTAEYQNEIDICYSPWQNLHPFSISFWYSDVLYTSQVLKVVRNGKNSIFLLILLNLSPNKSPFNQYYPKSVPNPGILIILIPKMGPAKRICVFEHSVLTNFNCACPAIQRGQGSGFLSEGSSWLTACMSEQRRFWRDCADAQARLNLRCSHRR